MIRVTASPLNLATASGTALRSWRKSVGLNRPIFAGLGNFSERSLASYERHKRIPVSARPQISEAARLVTALLQIIPKENLREWLMTPNSGFNGEKPIKLIHNGERDVIWAMIHQTRQGGFA
jgi:DNA-binding transcriptional regulator YiaG